MGRSLGKLFLSKHSQVTLGEGSFSLVQPPIFRALQAHLWDLCWGHPCSSTPVHHPFYFLYHLLLPASFYLPRANFSQVQPAHRIARPAFGPGPKAPKPILPAVCTSGRGRPLNSTNLSLLLCAMGTCSLHGGPNESERDAWQRLILWKTMYAC